MPKILLVEDDPLVQMTTKIMLNKLGCEIDTFSTGNEALEKAKNSNDYILFLVDVGLPDISGVEVIKKIRENKGAEATIIAVTGYTDDKTKQECLDAGVTEVLHKPILLDGFKDLLKRYKIIED
jgi:two-component system aerobic respiration control sensor histidine kinase ArcB